MYEETSIVEPESLNAAQAYEAQIRQIDSEYM